MVRAWERKLKFQCIRCGMRSLYNGVLGVCNSFKWVKENHDRGKHQELLQGYKFMGEHRLQCAVDVEKVRNLIWC